MDEATLKEFAKQLRKPEGEFGLQVGEKMNKGNVHMYAATIEALHVSAGDSILEIGMANGFFVKDILAIDPSITYSGCDYSALMVDESTKLNDQYVRENRAKFFNATAEKLPFDNETFNTVFTINTLYFWNDYKAVLNEIKRVLKPSGQFIISIRPKSLMQYYPFVKYGFKMFSPEEVAALLQENDFVFKNAYERTEPDQEINGEKVKVATLVITAEKK